MLHVQMPDGELVAFASYSDPALDQALRQGGRPVRVNTNTGAVTYQFTLDRIGGGYLLDGCPINIVMGAGWLPGQVDALKAAGITPRCTECAVGTVCWEEFEWGAEAVGERRYTETDGALTSEPAPAPAPAPTSPSTAANIGPQQTPVTVLPGAPLSVTAYGGSGGAGGAAADAAAPVDASSTWLLDNWPYIVAGLGLLMSLRGGKRS